MKITETQYQHKPILETERLILRPIRAEDYLDAFEWCGDPVVNKYMLYSLYTKAEDVRKWIESIDHNNPDAYEYAFVEKESGKVIGSGGLYYHEDIDVWAVGYNLRHDRWGRGYVTEAERAIIEYVNSIRPIRELQGEFAQENVGSGKVMEKLGMSYLRDCEYTKWDGSATFKAYIYSSLAGKKSADSESINGRPNHPAENKIRKISESDAPSICEICSEEMGYKCSLSLVQEKIKNLDSRREAVFVAEVKSQVVGFVHVECYDVLYFESMANLLGLAVKRDFQKLGLGKALLLAAEKWAKEKGIRLMRLNSGINRTDAHAFYEHLGYVSEKEQKRFLKAL